MKIAIAGGVGGVVQLIPAVPTEVIKVVLQSQIPHGNMNNSGTYHILGYLKTSGYLFQSTFVRCRPYTIMILTSLKPLARF